MKIRFQQVSESVRSTVMDHLAAIHPVSDRRTSRTLASSTLFRPGTALGLEVAHSYPEYYLDGRAVAIGAGLEAAELKGLRVTFKGGRGSAFVVERRNAPPAVLSIQEGAPAINEETLSGLPHAPGNADFQVRELHIRMLNVRAAWIHTGSGDSDVLSFFPPGARGLFPGRFIPTERALPVIRALAVNAYAELLRRPTLVH